MSPDVSLRAPASVRYENRALPRRAWQSFIVLLIFIANTIGPIPLLRAQQLPSPEGEEFTLPAPGMRVGLSPEYNPPVLKGIKVHPDNPFRFDFILDQGDEAPNQTQNVKTEATRLIKYFLASLTIPEKDLWVNLSPYEKDRVIPQSFGLTEMGRDLLVEDYMLKQITASLIYPEDKTGKKFWKRIYEEAYKKFGTTNIPVNTFNKVWIVPDKAVVYENAKAGTAYMVESKLKVMLEQDYLAVSRNSPRPNPPHEEEGINSLGSQIVREIVIPELTKEVNEGKNFIQLRQVYNSLILATWYKKKIKDSIINKIYSDRNKIVGVGYTKSRLPSNEGLNVKATQRNTPHDVESIYQRYLQAFKKGVFNYIKEEISLGLEGNKEGMYPRKYFSGGEVFIAKFLDEAMTTTGKIDTAMFEPRKGHQITIVSAGLSVVRGMRERQNRDMAQLSLELMRLFVDKYFIKFDREKIDFSKGDPEWLGMGELSWVIGYRDAVYRILYQPDTNDEFYNDNSVNWSNEEKYFKLLGPLNISPKFISNAFIKIRREFYDAYYVTEVERVHGKTLRSFGPQLTEEEKADVIKLVDDLISINVYFSDFKPSNIVIGSIRRENKLGPKKGYIVDVSNAVEDDSRRDLIKKYIACFQAKYSDEYSSRNFDWHTLDPEGDITKHLEQKLASLEEIRNDSKLPTQAMKKEEISEGDVEKILAARDSAQLGARGRALANSKGTYHDIGNLLTELKKAGISAHMQGQTLDKLAENPQKLAEYFRQYSVIKNSEEIKRVLQAKLDSVQGRDLPAGVDASSAEGLFNAIFDQEKFLAQYSEQRPLNVVIFRGGRGASQYTEALKNLPHVRVQIILGAVDDGRSWYVAARDFRATGVPDAGKSLLDLSEDQAVKELLSMRLIGSEPALLEEDIGALARGLENGGPQEFHYSQMADAYWNAANIVPEKRRQISVILNEFLETMRGKYRWSKFSLNQIPLRSVIILGAVWGLEKHDDPDSWQKAVDEVGMILGVKRGSRVILPTRQRQYLVAMTGDGTIYGAETGINEYLEKRSPFIGLWLMDKPFDIYSFKDGLKKKGIEADLLRVDNRKNVYDPDLVQEIQSTTLHVPEKDAYRTARMLANVSTTAGKGSRIWLSPAAQAILANADTIIYGNTTFESNIGSSLIIPGMGAAIEAAHAVKIHIVNPTSEAEPHGTTALGLLERLYRYATRQFLYTHPGEHWKGVERIVNYMIGVPMENPGLDINKAYLPFDRNEIKRKVGKRVTTIPLDLEVKEPTQRPAKNYMDVNPEWGFYDPHLLREATIALVGIHAAGFKIMADDKLVKDDPQGKQSIDDSTQLADGAMISLESLKEYPKELQELIETGETTVKADDGVEFIFTKLSASISAAGTSRDRFRIAVRSNSNKINGFVDVRGNEVHVSLKTDIEGELGQENYAIKVKHNDRYQGIGRTLMSLAMEVSKYLGNTEFYVIASADDVFYETLKFHRTEGNNFRFDLISQPLPVIGIKRVLVKKQKDPAMSFSTPGGIDLTPAHMNVQTKFEDSRLPFGPSASGLRRWNGTGIRFHIDPAMLQQLEDSPGFEPVIVNVQSLPAGRAGRVALGKFLEVQNFI